MWRRKGFGLIFLALICMPLSACQFAMKTENFYGLQTGSPLKSVSPTNFIIHPFEDTREEEASTIRSFNVNRKTDKPIAKVVEDAIKKELQRNGHKFLESSSTDNKAIVIEGTVYQFSLASTPGILYMTLSGDVAVKITAYPSNQPDNMFIKKYKGHYSGEWIAPRQKEPLVMNEALLEMISEFTTDEEFIMFLNKTKNMDSR